MMLFEETHKAPTYFINLFFKASLQMFSDFLKRMNCPHREKKVSKPSGCKDRPFYCKSMCCCLVCFAARKMGTDQDQWCCFLPSFISWLCNQSSPVLTMSSPLDCPCYRDSEYRDVKVQNEVILFFLFFGVSSAKDWISSSSQFMALCFYLSMPISFLVIIQLHFNLWTSFWPHFSYSLLPFLQAHQTPF